MTSPTSFFSKITKTFSATTPNKTRPSSFEPTIWRLKKVGVCRANGPCGTLNDGDD